MAENLSKAWNAPEVTMRARQQLLRTLIADIIVDVDETVRDALAVMRSMAGRWSDEHIAASLNRMGLPTGQRVRPGREIEGQKLADHEGPQAPPRS